MGAERTLRADGSVRARPIRVSWQRAVATLGGLLAISPWHRRRTTARPHSRGGRSSAARGWCRRAGASAVPASRARPCARSCWARSPARGGFAADSQSGRDTRTVLDINQTFIASLVVCHSDTTADTTPTKEEPGLEKPKVAVPLPAPPPAPKPPPALPKPVVVAPPPAPPPTPPCLEITPAKEEQYALVNRRCRGHTVLAVIETRGAGGETVCKGYSIGQSLAVRTAGSTPPRINHECVLSQGPCNRDRLENMFPECDW